MGCGCNKRKVRQKTESHKDIIEKLQIGLCRIDFKSHPDKHNSVYCTLQHDVLPTSGSNLYRQRDSENTKMKSDNILVWAFNKNRDKEVDSGPGWFKINLKDIDNYEFLQPIERK